jgi:site-specific DNA-methyltransferase (adenine-specific)
VKIGKYETHPAADVPDLFDETALAELADDIKAKGLLQPITLYQGLLLDGRNRLLACERAGVEPRFVVYDGDAPWGHAWSLNGPRRNETPERHLMNAARYKEGAATENAQKRQREHGGTAPGRPKSLSANLREVSHKAADDAAKLAGVSPRSLESASKVLKTGSPDLIAAVESGAVAVSRAAEIAKASDAEVKRAEDAKKAAAKAQREAAEADKRARDEFRKATEREKARADAEAKKAEVERQKRLEAEARAEAAEKATAALEEEKKRKEEKARAKVEAKAAKAAAHDATLLPATEAQLLVGDLAEAGKEISDVSVDAIITDPPYPQEFLHLYSELARLAARVLKPGGSCIVMAGQSYLPEILLAMTPVLRYQWTCAYLTPGGKAVQVWQRKVNTFWKPLLWFVKGTYAGEWIGDVTKSATNDNDKRFHEWGQSESGMADIIERFSLPGQTVLDPFCGAGTTGVVCARLKRRFIGIDIDPKHIATTKRRLGVA